MVWTIGFLLKPLPSAVTGRGPPPSFDGFRRTPPTTHPFGSLACGIARVVPPFGAYAIPPPPRAPLHEPRLLGPVHAAHVAVPETLPPGATVAVDGGRRVGEAAAAGVAGMDAAARCLLPRVQVRERGRVTNLGQAKPITSTGDSSGVIAQ